MLMQTKEFLKKRFTDRMIGEKLGLASFIARKYMTQAAKFEMPVLREALEECVQMDQDIKTGRLADLIAVEMLIIKYSNVVNK